MEFHNDGSLVAYFDQQPFTFVKKDCDPPPASRSPKAIRRVEIVRLTWSAVPSSGTALFDYLPARASRHIGQILDVRHLQLAGQPEAEALIDRMLVSLLDSR